MAEGRFVRVYHEDLIEHYEQIWLDDRALATWLRLLVLADTLWPSPADLPRRLSKTSLDKLVKDKLVSLLPGGRFRIRGLDAQRQRQRDAAKAASDARWKDRPEGEPDDGGGGPGGGAGGNAERIPGGNANGKTPATHTRTRPRFASAYGDSSVSTEEAGTLRARGGNGGSSGQLPPDVVRLQGLAEQLTSRPYVLANTHGGHGAKAIDLLDRHGYPALERAMRSVADGLPVRPTLRQLVFGAEDRLDAIPPAPRRSAGDAERAEFEQVNAELKQRAAANRARRLATEGVGNA